MTPPIEVTDDTLLDGRVNLRQPSRGYRVAIDPVLLAAAVPARAGERVVDLGTGVGAAALCCAIRVPGCAVLGIELQADLVNLAVTNVERNHLADAVRVVGGDVLAPPLILAQGSFDHAMANPPFAPAGSGTPSREATKQTANVEGGARLADWVAAAGRAVKPGGTVTFVHRADRLAELLGALAGAGAGGAVVFPLWPRAGEDCRRLLVQAKRESKAPLRVAAGLVLHGPDGAYTAAAQAVLRGGARLDL